MMTQNEMGSKVNNVLIITVSPQECQHFGM